MQGSVAAGLVAVFIALMVLLVLLWIGRGQDREREQELHRHIEELERMQAEKAALDELKRDFMAMASHEVRTPITAIRGFAMTLSRHWERLSDDERRRSLDAVERQATRLWQLVSDVLTASQLEGGTVDASVIPVTVGVVIQRAIAEANLDPALVTTQCPDDLRARIDASHLARILSALLSNAGKYGRPPIVVRVDIDGSDLVIRVIDQGQGIPAGFHDQLFEPFTQASTGVTREAIGTGLGLGVARGLARVAGGDVWHEPARRDGTTFAARVPMAAARSTSDAAESGSSEAPTLSVAVVAAGSDTGLLELGTDRG